MTIRNACALSALAFALTTAPSAAENATTGFWTAHRLSSDSSKVAVGFRTDDDQLARGSWNGSFDVDVAQLGLPAADLDSTGKHVEFTLARDAGSFACDGWAGKGQGAGTFAFSPSTRFLDGLRARGLGEPTTHKLLGAASVDLTLDYIDRIASSGYPHLPLDRLITFRALRVTPESVAELRRTFSADLSAEDVVSLAALRVTPAYVTEMRSLGISVPSAQKAIQLRALRIDRSYVESLAKAGYPNLDAEQIVQLKALGVDDVYIRHLASHGFTNLTVSKLVQLKALGI